MGNIKYGDFPMSKRPR